MDSPIEIRIAEALRELAETPNLSLRAVQKKHGIPRSTLARRLGGGISKKTARQPQQLLTPEQEDLLVHWLLTLEADGHAPTHNTVREMAIQISTFSGGKTTIGNK
jgi:Tc5 transposase DNA-binding domain/helix-turn-helix, Psq domain